MYSAIRVHGFDGCESTRFINRAQIMWPTAPRAHPAASTPPAVRPSTANTIPCIFVNVARWHSIETTDDQRTRMLLRVVDEADEASGLASAAASGR